ncbi:hypothetical protein [Synechococcus sp. PCC 6312]|uniref:hypothetical protein n=1 Tax=Synechococcus sp. (strain ATCC 27167 / PCC 6312) TaxID=195253 RepID=UPI0002FE8B6C|nr:hypothetical protein [Synechococcus sp. PCC 6312]
MPRQIVWTAIAPRVGEVVDFAPLFESVGTTVVLQRSWLLALSRAGYLLRQGRGGRFQVLRHTGVLAPMRRKDGSLYDPNTAGPIELGALRVWVALLINKVLTQPEAAALCDLSVQRVAELLSAWQRVGAVRVSRVGTGNGLEYRIVRDQPICPIVTPHGVFDVYLNKFLEVANDG